MSTQTVPAQPGTTTEIARTQSAEVAMTLANTQYSWTLPYRCREFLLMLQSPVIAWRFSSTTGQVAAGGGTPLGAGSSIAFNDGMYTGTVYFASSSAAQVMRVEYVQALEA